MSEALLTTAERTSFRETGRLAEIELLCDRYAQTWPEAVRSFEYGLSADRELMRALLISRTGLLSAAALRARDVPLLMIQAGIHPGESDGKDAGFIALRELLQASRPNNPLERIAILFVPAFNTDGHERFGRWNRPNQNGPEESGWRTTSQNLNLNRDYTKADTPEMRAMLHLLNTWDPLICADLHVTDGADFEPDISIQVEPINQGDPALHASAHELRESLVARLHERGSLALTFYPDFATTDDPASGFALTVYSPRFSTGYFPQRNRFTVLVETHSWKDYAHRVQIMCGAILDLADLTAHHGRGWLQRVRQSDEAARHLAGTDMPLDYSCSWREPPRAGDLTPARGAAADARLIDFRGYAYTRETSAISGTMVTRYDPTSPQIWRVPLRDRVSPSALARVPHGYVVPVAFAAELAPRLEAHGISFSRIARRRDTIGAELFRVAQVSYSAAPFEGRMRAKLQGTWTEQTTNLLAGSLYVPAAQPLARLVVALLEPEAPDSFAAWGFFNACFEQKEQVEPYVAELMAREVLESNVVLREAFTLRLQDSQFAADPAARLEFLLRHHPAWDDRQSLYPIVRLPRPLA